MNAKTYKKEKACLAAVSGLLAGGGVVIYFLATENGSSNKSTDVQNMPEDNHTEDSDLHLRDDSGTSSKRTNNPVSRKNNLKEDSDKKGLENTATQEFLAVISEWEQEPDPKKSANFAHQAEEAFQRAKNAQMENDSFLNSPNLPTFLSHFIKFELEKPQPAETVVKNIRILRHLNPEHPLAFSKCNALDEMRAEYAKLSKFEKEAARKVAREAALETISKFDLGTWYVNRIDPMQMVQLTPAELLKLRTCFDTEMDKQNHTFREASYFTGNIFLLNNLIQISDLTTSNTLVKEWVETRFKLHDCKEFRSLIQSDMPYSEKGRVLHCACFYYAGINPLDEALKKILNPSPEEHLNFILSQIVESLRSGKNLPFLATFFSINSENEIEPMVKLVREKGFAERVCIYLSQLQDTHVTPNSFYKHFYDRLKS